MKKTCNHILVVEDDMDIRQQIAQILADEGYKVDTCENGKTALEYLTSKDVKELPSCIILDLQMPIMTGNEFLDKIRIDDRYKDIPVLVATAKGSPKVELKELPPNVSKINKPMDINELISTVESVCGKPSLP